MNTNENVTTAEKENAFNNTSGSSSSSTQLNEDEVPKTRLYQKVYNAFGFSEAYNFCLSRLAHSHFLLKREILGSKILEGRSAKYGQG